MNKLNNMKRKRKTKARLYKIVYKGRLYTGYNKALLKDLILGLRLNQK